MAVKTTESPESGNLGEQAVLAAYGDPFNYRRFMGVATRITRSRSDAEESLQDATLGVISASIRGTVVIDPTRAYSLLYRAIVNKSIDRARPRKERLSESPLLESDHETVFDTTREDQPEAAYVLRETTKELREKIDRLSKRQRQIIMDTYYESLSQSEIALKHNIPIGTVKTRVRLALIQLRKIVRPREEWE